MTLSSLLHKLVAAAAGISVAASTFPATTTATDAPFTPPNPFGRTALVLAGGGAKGAYTVGVIETICKDPEPLPGLKGQTCKQK